MGLDEKRSWLGRDCNCYSYNQHNRNIGGLIMKRINFREVTKKLNELKQAESRAKGDYHSEDEILSGLELYNVRSDLERLRNTKISDLHYLFN